MNPDEKYGECLNPTHITNCNGSYEDCKRTTQKYLEVLDNTEQNQLEKYMIEMNIDYAVIQQVENIVAQQVEQAVEEARTRGCKEQTTKFKDWLLRWDEEQHDSFSNSHGVMIRRLDSEIDRLAQLSANSREIKDE